MTRHFAGRFPIDPDAFSRDLRMRGKHPRQVIQSHRSFVASLPCLVCFVSRGILSRKNVQAAHLRAGNPIYGKRKTGMGEKSNDQFVLPLCNLHHAEQHAMNELVFWNRYWINDPWKVALALFGVSGDEEAAELIIKEARHAR